MNKKEIRMHASKIWRLLVDNSSWTMSELKKRTGLNDAQVGAAIGWLAHENKIEFNQDADCIHASIYVNVYIG